jgi:hypothetical protein
MLKYPRSLGNLYVWKAMNWKRLFIIGFCAFGVAAIVTQISCGRRMIEMSCETDSDCEASQICGAGGLCRPDSQSATSRLTCERDTDCRPGEICKDKTCQKAECLADRDCEKAGFVCKDGRCEAGCQSNSECTGARICRDGQCLFECQSDDDC